jgi:heme-degrading monooxygenase HmoA
MPILTMAAGNVPDDRVDDLVAGYQALLQGPFPDGLLETSLLRGEGHEWAVATLWRDREAIVAMRASGEPPAALRLFADVGGQPRAAVYEVVATATPG